VYSGDVARVEVADDAVHAVVDQALRDGRAGARVGLIVFGLQCEGDRLAADHRMRRVEIVDRELRTLLHVGAVVRLLAGQRRGKTDLHDIGVRGLRAGGPRERRCDHDMRYLQLHCDSPRVWMNAGAGGGWAEEGVAG
jgi:hypothetical protein